MADPHTKLIATQLTPVLYNMSREVYRTLTVTGRLSNDLSHWVQPIATVLGASWKVPDAKPVPTRDPSDDRPSTVDNSWQLPISGVQTTGIDYSFSFSGNHEFVEATLAAESFVETTVKLIRSRIGASGPTVDQVNKFIWDSLLSPDRVGPLISVFVRRVAMSSKWRMMTASGATTKRWVLGSGYAEPCARCKGLSGKVVPIDEPFLIDPKGGRYAVVYHPPLHPGCLCGLTEA